MPPLRVLIVEDHPMMQEGIRKALERFSDIEVIGEAQTGSKATCLAAALDPDVVLMDVRLPDSDGISTLKAIKGGSNRPKVLMLSGFDDEKSVISALESGANGYLLKTIGGRELAEAIRQTAEGMSPLSPEITSGVLSSICHQGPRPWDKLTPREREIWALLASGATNDEICSRLFIAASTIKFHIRNVFHKLGIRNRTEAAVLAYKSGFLESHPLNPPA